MKDCETMTPAEIEAFIQRWAKSGGAERANYQLFLTELCDVLDVAHPEPTVPEASENAYVFDKSVEFDNRDGTHTTKFIDFYRRGSFVLETKHGVERDDSELVLSGAAKEKKKRRKKGHGTRGTPAVAKPSSAKLEDRAHPGNDISAYFWMMRSAMLAWPASRVRWSWMPLKVERMYSASSRSMP